MADDLGLWYHSNPQIAESQKRKVYEELVNRRNAGEDGYSSSMTAEESRTAQAQILQDMYGGSSQSSKMSTVTSDSKEMDQARKMDASAYGTESPEKFITTPDGTSYSDGTSDVRDKADVITDRRTPSALADSLNGSGTTTTTSTSSTAGQTASYLDDASTTVAGQLERLLDSDSAYVQDARRRAGELSQARGWGASSMAMGAGELAAVQGALPIAQQDAETAYSRLEAGEERQHDMDVLDVKYGQESEQAALDRTHDMDILDVKYSQESEQAALDRTHDFDLTEFDNDFQANQNLLDREWKTALNDDNNQAAEDLQNVMALNDQNQSKLDYEFDRALQQLEGYQDRQTMFHELSNSTMHDYNMQISDLITNLPYLELEGLNLQDEMDKRLTEAMNQISFYASATKTEDVDRMLDAAYPMGEDGEFDLEGLEDLFNDEEEATAVEEKNSIDGGGAGNLWTEISY